MICFEKKDAVVLKYQVIFNPDMIQALYREVIDNCSFIRHKEVDLKDVVMPEFRVIKNYKVEGNKATYDEYEPCKLAGLIERVLQNDEKVYGELANYSLEKGPLSRIDSEIEYQNWKMCGEYSDGYTTKEKHESWIMCQRLKGLKEININQKGTKEYYEALMNQLSFELIDELPIEEINRVESFFEVEVVKENNGIVYRKARRS